MITAPGVVALAGSYHGILLIDPPPPLYAAHIVQDRLLRPCAGAIVCASRAYRVWHGVDAGYPRLLCVDYTPMRGGDGIGAGRFRLYEIKYLTRLFDMLLCAHSIHTHTHWSLCHDEYCRDNPHRDHRPLGYCHRCILGI